MADITNVTDNYFTVVSETFSDNLSASIGAGAATVPVNNATEYTDGDQVTLVVEPGTANEAVFTGEKSGNSFINCDWTEGNVGVGHAAGATVVDYITATQHNMMTKGIKQFANDDGTLKTQPVRNALGLTDPSAAGWEVAPYTFAVSSGYNKGQREHEVQVLGQDLTDEYSPGMKFKFTRGTAAPTQCADLESTSSQYASRASGSLTGITFTDDFTIEAWIKLESYATAGASRIISRYNVTGWLFSIDATGRLYSETYGGGGNRVSTSYQSIPLNKWVHVAATVDMSAGSVLMYMDGILVPNTTTGAGTSFAQAGNLTLGIQSDTLTLPFDGKIADVRIWNTVRNITQIRDNMNQQLVGTETNLVGYWKLNGNFNDSTTNANNLTGSGGAVATNVDNPMKNVEYALLHKIVYSGGNSTLTLFTGNDHTIPNMTLTAPHYSTQKSPYGFPGQTSKWEISILFRAVLSHTNPAAGATVQNVLSGAIGLVLPVGEWTSGGHISLYHTRGAAGYSSAYVGWSEANAVVTNPIGRAHGWIQSSAGTFEHAPWLTPGNGDVISLSTTKNYYFFIYGENSMSAIQLRGDWAGKDNSVPGCIWVFRNAYL